eukprot:7262709-Ditylum_brightwellii.AAC.1
MANEIFWSNGFTAQNILERNDLNDNDKDSLHDAVECVDFLNTIDFYGNDNYIAVDLDALNKHL